MYLGEISFCDKVGYNMRSDDDKTAILKDVEERFGIRVLKRHHDVFCPESARMINGNPFLAALRSNGNPYYLYLTRLDFVETCIFIDKKIQQGYFLPRMIIVKLWFDAHLFDDTLLEGEMVKRRDGTWLFLVGDILVDCGVALTNHNLVRRLNRLYALLARHWKRSSMDICDIQVKKYVPVTDVRTLVDSLMPSLDYTCRGIYYKPFFLKFRDVLLNFDDSLVKKVTRTKYKETSNFLLLDHVENDAVDAAKSSTMSTKVTKKDRGDDHDDCAAGKEAEAEGDRVFLIKKTSLPDIYEVYLNAADVGRRVCTEACVPSIGVSKYLRSLFLHMGVTDTLPMVCQYNEKFQKWVPMRPVDL
jgi:hypothetical protein